MPLNTLNYSETEALTGKIFKRSDLAQALGIQENLLPIMAALGGTDYLSTNDMEIFIANNPGLRLLQSKGAGKKYKKNIIKICRNLGRLDFQEASNAW